MKEEKRPRTGPKGLLTVRGHKKDQELAKPAKAQSVNFKENEEVSVQDRKQKDRHMLGTRHCMSAKSHRFLPCVFSEGASFSNPKTASLVLSL